MIHWVEFGLLARYKHRSFNGWHDVVVLHQKVKPNNHGDIMGQMSTVRQV